VKIYDEFSPHFCLEGCRQTQLHGSAGARLGGSMEEQVVRVNEG